MPLHGARYPACPVGFCRLKKLLEILSFSLDRLHTFVSTTLYPSQRHNARRQEAAERLPFLYGTDIEALRALNSRISFGAHSRHSESNNTAMDVSSRTSRPQA